MSHFVELEENALSLMNQWQENEEITEVKKKDKERLVETTNRVIEGLEVTVRENKMRSAKIYQEKTQLEFQ